MSHSDELPCIVYDKTYSAEAKWDKVKLSQNFDDGSKRTRTVPVFDGEYGIEALLMVVNKFKKAAAHMEWTDDELFD